MNFHELSSFIEGSLESAGEDSPETEAPQSREDFIELWDLLCEKTYAEVIINHPGTYRPSLNLRKLDKKLERTRGYLIDPGSKGISKKKLSGVEKREEELYEEVEELKKVEQERHRQLVSDYESRESRIARNMRKQIDRTFELEHGSPISLPWELLPQGERTFDKMRAHQRDLQRRGVISEFDEDRLEKAYSLGSENQYMGTGKMEGYIIFTFAHTPKVLMERPVTNNAIYIIEKDWEELSKELTKQELREHPSVVWTPHRGDWFKRVKEELELL
jgi:hypothetical protein